MKVTGFFKINITALPVWKTRIVWKTTRVWKARRVWKTTRSIENYKTTKSLEDHEVSKSTRVRTSARVKEGFQVSRSHNPKSLKDRQTTRIKNQENNS